MSRSFRKTPICGMAGSRRTSEKLDKQIANRTLRRHTKQNIFHEIEIMPYIREVSNVWNMNKDGKFRFDPNKHKKLMRK